MIKILIKTMSLKGKIKLGQAFNWDRGGVRQHIVAPFSKRANCGFITSSLFTPVGFCIYTHVENILENNE